MGRRKEFWLPKAIGLLFLVGVLGCSSLLPPDSGLIGFCWHGRVSDFACEHPDLYSWSRGDIPLVVSTAASDTRLLEEVMLEINEEVGCEILVLDPTSDTSRVNSDIIVILDAPYTPGERGIAYTTFRRMGLTRVQAFITTFALGLSRPVQRNALFHELGHALGLAHDDWNGSIMRRAQNDRIVGFSDYDRSLLNSLYCPETNSSR